MIANYCGAQIIMALVFAVPKIKDLSPGFKHFGLESSTQ